ncbi:folylpolyglutamate synthase/dihydrofolate synthase [archaeon]|jgi:dihydrofolate synthase/folylpolyglutamate synthase|nr:folylpolyglutamate synthase/dihydrofolate synthase [archaeon]MDP6547866.1 folylpolyglutamate synthase/dihydrofolate synthase family protein [Candidatus Woesearchaeota archaeon]|tara:strand:+ start:8317 stop:9540 length:1224 start_codon:yes stop_codon:yes gene_type:complete
MKCKTVLKELYSLDSGKFKLDLSQISILLKKLNNPEKQLKCIHVAGTNGKGSVCAMLSSILSDANYKVGMYTSPHLKRFNERIRINHKLITDNEIAEYYQKIKPFITKQSFFEITTAMAFLYFYDKKVDFAVLEVGLGGRLDATNVVKPLISIITNIGYEHTDYLGDSISKIAYEKAGIIKKDIPVVTSAKGIALKTIKRISNKKNSKLFIINNKTVIKEKNNIKNNLSFNINNHKNLKLDNLKGEFQLKNAAIAIKALDIIKKNNKIKINEKNIKNGLKNAKWPGRFDFIGRNVLVDCAHNPEAFETLMGEIKNLDYNKLIMVLGLLDDKDIKKISDIIKPYADKIILTKPDNERAINAKSIKKYFGMDAFVIENRSNAFKFAKNISSDKDLVVIAGSIFLVKEFL